MASFLGGGFIVFENYIAGGITDTNRKWWFGKYDLMLQLMGVQQRNWIGKEGG